MDAKIKERWLAALRSGEYKQGKSRLRTTEGKFCCLGVLCDLAVKDGLGEWKQLQGPSPIFEATNGEVAVGELPHAVLNWAGMISKNPRVKSPGLLAGSFPSLAEINDATDVGFGTIATLIEEQY